MKESRVKVVMADLALSQLHNRSVSSLDPSEYRRLCIGVQLVRDPSKIFKAPDSLMCDVIKIRLKWRGERRGGKKEVDLDVFL